MMRVLGLVATSLAVGGCPSTDSVRQLADKTAANVGTISVHMARLDANSRAMARQRAANIAALYAANRELHARYQLDVALTRKTGGGANLAFLDDIEKWRTEVEAIVNVDEEVEATHKKVVLETQTALDTKSKTLADIAKSLASLAEEESRQDRLRFFTGYAKNLRQNLKTVLDQDDKAASAVKSILGDARAELEANIDTAKRQGTE